MKAAIVKSPGEAPIYADFEEPVLSEREVLIDVTAASLSQVTRARAAGTHYSSLASSFPFVPGIDGVGRRRDDGERLYFFLPRAPFGSMAEHVVASASCCVSLPDAIDDVTAAAIAIPGMSSWAALKERARLRRGDVVLINGATGISGRLAVQIARHLGAGKIIVTGRNARVLDELGAGGADAAISLTQDDDLLGHAFAKEFTNGGIDIILDYLWGPSAERLLGVAATEQKDRAVRFVQIGSASASAITLPYAVLRSCPLELMGCGLGSISLKLILNSVAEVLRAAAVHRFEIPTEPVSLADVENRWTAGSSTMRTVFVTGA